MSSQKINYVNLTRYYSKTLEKECNWVPNFLNDQVEVMTAARSTKDSENSNTYNHLEPFYFLDVGAWAGGPDGKPTTSFGVISGYDIFLCSWLKYGGGQSYRKCEGEGPAYRFENVTSPAKAFFEAAAKIKPDRCYILAHTKLPDRLPPFTEKSEVLIIVGDLHLQIQHVDSGSPVDRFVYKDNNGRGRTKSLDEDLRDLLDLAEDLKLIELGDSSESSACEKEDSVSISKSAYSITTIQVGDMYDVWIAECILRYRLLQLNLLVEYPDIYVKEYTDNYLHDVFMKDRGIKHFDIDRDYDREEKIKGWLKFSCWKTVLKMKLVPMALVRNNELKWTEESILGWAEQLNLHYCNNEYTNADEYFNYIKKNGRYLRYTEECVDASSTKDIINHIRMAHGKLFGSKKKLCDVQLSGNHDNFLQNNYWKEEQWPKDIFYKTDIFDSDSSKHTSFLNNLMFPTSGYGEGIQREHQAAGKGDCIWIEHGHCWDIDNCDEDKHGKGENKGGWERGFNLVYLMIRGLADTFLSTGTDAVMLNLANNVADGFAHHFMAKEMRFFLLLRSDAILFDTRLTEGKKTRLFVAGHTHSPMLVDRPKGFSLFWAYPKAIDYFQGNDIMEEAKKFANELISKEGLKGLIDCVNKRTASTPIVYTG